MKRKKKTEAEMDEKKFERKIEESYNHIKPYLKDQKILAEMCGHCERYCGKEHDYEECRNMPCFKCFLGYSYLQWLTSWE